MEREGPEVMVRLMRSIRSLAYNRELQPLVEDRIERAESSLRGYLLINGLAATRVGFYQVEMDEEGDTPSHDCQLMIGSRYHCPS